MNKNRKKIVEKVDYETRKIRKVIKTKMLTPRIRVILQSLLYKPVHIHHILFPYETRRHITVFKTATAVYLASLAVRVSY
jgi:hypothetical protein